MEPRRRALAIINPATGAVSVNRVRKVLERLADETDTELKIVETKAEGHATDLARDHASDVDLIIAVGGDGTMSEVVTGAIDSDVWLALIPRGTTNMIAKDLGIPLSISGSARCALTGTTTVTLDVAKVDGTVFMHMGGAGLDAVIMRETSSRWKRIFRWVAYVWPGLQELRQKPFPAEVDVDGETYQVRARMILFALGGSLVHPRFTVGRGIDRMDGQLDVIVADPPTLSAILETVFWFMLRKPYRSRWHHHYRGRKVSVTSDRPVPVEFDGSYYGELPVTIEIQERGVTVVVPKLPTPGEIKAHAKW